MRRATGALSIVAALMAVSLLMTPIIVAEEDGMSDDPTLVAGSTILAASETLFGEDGNSSQAVAAPHLVELYTATWCIPCRSAEAEIESLDTWWPSIMSISYHPSLDSPDELSTNVSADIKSRYGAQGYPTLVVDGGWSLLGETQSQDLRGLLTSRVDNELEGDLEQRVQYSWSSEGASIVVDFEIGEGLVVDFLVVRDSVTVPGTQHQVDGVVRSGAVNQTANGSVEIVIESGVVQRLITLVRVAGEPLLEPGSSRPVGDGMGEIWTPSDGSGSTSLISRNEACLIAFIGAIVVGSQMTQTVPALFRRGSRVSAVIEEEE